MLSLTPRAKDGFVHGDYPHYWQPEGSYFKKAQLIISIIDPFLSMGT